METKYFLGSNTGSGFKGAYAHILGGKVIILKGGAGTGKSTIMKKAAAAAIARGYDAELYYCSSDVDSLDAVYIPALNAAVVDGTAPHVTEAEYPAVSHYIVNLLDNADSDKLIPFGATIKNCVAYKKQYFNSAYAYLKCADTLITNLDNLVTANVNKDKIDAIANQIFDKIAFNVPRQSYSLFCSAITNKGIINNYSQNFNDVKKVALSSEFDIQSILVLERLKTKLAATNTPCVTFINPLRLGRAEGILAGDTLITFDRFIDGEIVDLSISIKPFGRYSVSRDVPLIDDLISRAIENVNYAHLTHMEIEKLYFSAMDWADINKKTQRIIDLLLIC